MCAAHRPSGSEAYSVHTVVVVGLESLRGGWEGQCYSY